MPIPHQGTREHENWAFLRSFGVQHYFEGGVWTWPFSVLETLKWPKIKWCCKCPQEGILMCWVVFTGFQDHWVPNIGGNSKKFKNFDFSGHWPLLQNHAEDQKSSIKVQFSCSLGPRWAIGIWKNVSKCLFGFSQQLRVKKMSLIKNCHNQAGITV